MCPTIGATLSPDETNYLTIGRKFALVQSIVTLVSVVTACPFVVDDAFYAYSTCVSMLDTCGLCFTFVLGCILHFACISTN